MSSAGANLVFGIVSQKAFARSNKEAAGVKTALQRFLGPNVKPEHVYIDNAPELDKACEDLKYTFDTSISYRPQTNGVAERAMRKQQHACKGS